MDPQGDTDAVPTLHFRLVSQRWEEMDLLGKPVRVHRDSDVERPRRWLITTIESDGGRVYPFRGTEAEAHARARSLGADSYSLVPRFGV